MADAVNIYELKNNRTRPLSQDGIDVAYPNVPFEEF